MIRVFRIQQLCRIKKATLALAHFVIGNGTYFHCFSTNCNDARQFRINCSWQLSLTFLLSYRIWYMIYQMPICCFLWDLVHTCNFFNILNGNIWVSLIVSIFNLLSFWGYHLICNKEMWDIIKHSRYSFAQVNGF